jgi:YfiH family protein
VSRAIGTPGSFGTADSFGTPGSYGTPRSPIAPAWPVPAHVVARFTLREGGVSSGPWSDGRGGGGLNLGTNCGDDPQRVAENRRRVSEDIALPINWLSQVHGTRVLEVAGPRPLRAAERAERAERAEAPEVADAQVTTEPGIALAVLVADCLPVLLADRAGTVVGVAHAGWRGLAAGVLENTIGVMRSRRPGADLVAWLGPCIGPDAFEVGEDVLAAFANGDAGAAGHFAPTARPEKWLADLAALASRRLERAGVPDITTVGACTWSDAGRFWSYRRDGTCGRMAGIIGLRA